MDSESFSWTCEDVGNWLKSLGFENYVDLFVENQNIDGMCLLQLTEKDLKEPPLSIPKIGDIKKIMTNIYQLKVEAIGKNPELKEKLFCDEEHILDEVLKKQPKNNGKLSKPFFKLKQANHYNLSKPHTLTISKELKPEFFKLFMAFAYFSFAGLTTTFVMVVVHDRVPNMDIYPPLPDIVLDNVPYMPWAFKACEAIIISFTIVLWILLFFHKHRFIIARRLFAMLGTVFLLRCVTMLITSLSVPGTHLQCEPRGNHTLEERLKMALKIYKGLGLSIQGVRTCGDYLFSGHTVVVTLFNFFINEYTTRRFSCLHTISWVGNIFAIFFILAAHEHYSIDVFIAFYITSRLFLYYHSLANNKVLLQKDSRTQVWFPLFSYFESSIDGRVPNEFESLWVTISHQIKPLKKTL